MIFLKITIIYCVHFFVINASAAVSLFLGLMEYTSFIDLTLMYQIHVILILYHET